jgi:acetyltransferase-like isoleucine patch superfamily enzyme
VTREYVRKQKKVGSDLSVNQPSWVTPNTILGDNVNFNGMYMRGSGEVEIGDNFHSGPECMILTRNHNYDNGSTIPYDDTYISKKVTIKDNVWFGARVTVIPGITIGEGAIIQAGSAVTSDIPKGARSCGGDCW